MRGKSREKGRLKEVALGKMGRRDAMATKPPNKSASEWFKRPAYGKKEEKS